MKSVIVTASVYQGKNIPNKNEQWKAPVEEIILRNKREEDSKSRQEMMDEIEWYCKELDMPLPKGYPEQMSDSEGPGLW